MEEVAPTGGISVTGTGQVSVDAEIATMQVGVSLSGPDLEATRRAVATKATAARDHLSAAAVAGPDMTTSSLSVRSHQDHQSGRRVHHVSTRLTVVIRTLDAAEALVDELFSVIGDGIEMHGLTFGTEDPNAGRDLATTRAFEDALAKANHLAGLAGVRLGPVLSITEGGDGMHLPPPMMRAAAMSADASIPIESGELDQRASVAVRWAIEQP